MAPSLERRNATLRALVLLGAIGLIWIAARPLASQEPAGIITINLHASTHSFPHYWEKVFGSPRAINTMRESYRTDLSAIKLATGCDFVRFHGIFNDEVGLYREDEQGHPSYNFTYVDEIYDGLLAKGVRPFVELSFMPLALASGHEPSDFFYRANVSPPRDLNLWGDLVEHFARHLVERYGMEEVSQWYFEVWNEPNTSYWAGDPQQATYFRIYDAAAKAIDRVSPILRVGGPSTANSAWVGDLIRHATEDHISLDFVSTHAYATDSPGQALASHERVSRRDMVAREVLKVYDEVKASPQPGLPIIFSEYNASTDENSAVTDSSFMGPWLASTIARCDGLVDTLAYWSFSDGFDAKGVAPRPFHGGLGLIAVGHIPKASFNVFSLLHQLGTQRIPVDSDSVLATRRDDGSLAVAIWNYAPPGEGAAPRKFTLALIGAPDLNRAVIYRVDHDHGSPFPAWKAMGEPDFPTREQQQVLRDAGRLQAPEILALKRGSLKSLSLTIPGPGLAFILIQR